MDVSAKLDTVTQVQQGESYEDFYHRELPALVALAAAVTGSHLTAEDLAQEALVKAYGQWDRISTYDKPGAWARRVTINLALSSRKRAATEIRAKLRLGRLESRSEAALVPASEEYEPLWEAVRQLPGNQRAAVALRYLEDRSVAEIAEILECAESTAKVHLHRGRTALAERLRVDQSNEQQSDRLGDAK